MSSTMQYGKSSAARVRHALYRFLKTRPTIGCVLLALGGYFVLKPVIGSTFQFLSYLGVGGAQVYILGGGMVAAAFVAFFVPAQRHFPALMAMAFSITSLPLANLGGWLIGMVLGIVGSGLIFAWTPYSEKQLWRMEEKQAEKRARKTARKGPAADAGMASAA
jgi:hypothetical protein